MRVQPSQLEGTAHPGHRSFPSRCCHRPQHRGVSPQIALQQVNSWTPRHGPMVTTALITQGAQPKTEEGLEKRHKPSVCPLAPPVCLTLETSPHELLSVPAEVRSQVLKGYKTEQSIEADAQHCIKAGCLEKSSQMDASRARLGSGLPGLVQTSENMNRSSASFQYLSFSHQPPLPSPHWILTTNLNVPSLKLLPAL